MTTTTTIHLPDLIQLPRLRATEAHVLAQALMGTAHAGGPPLPPFAQAALAAMAITRQALLWAE